jgi:Peptidase S24-like
MSYEGDIVIRLFGNTLWQIRGHRVPCENLTLMTVMNCIGLTELAKAQAIAVFDFMVDYQKQDEELRAFFDCVTIKGTTVVPSIRNINDRIEENKKAAEKISEDRRIVRKALITHLRYGRAVRFRPYGKSMEPLLKEGDIVTIQPPTWREINANDIVLCTVNDAVLLHLVKSVEMETSGTHSDDQTTRDLFTICNAKGTVNGVIARSEIHGILTMVDATEEA